MYDYVIAGGGSAGCVLANRLSASGTYKVLLLEAGPTDSNPLIRIPAGIIGVIRSNVLNWKYWTVPQKNCGNRKMMVPRGRTLGGSSSINAMCYIRGHRWDYDHWAELGNPGWSFDQVLPYFLKLENFTAPVRPENKHLHATGGPLTASAPRDVNPLNVSFIDAAFAAGHRVNDDFNGVEQEGVGLYHVAQIDGERCSNARAYLPPEVRARPNLTIVTNARATNVLFEGKRAIGVRYLHGDQTIDAMASREVILSAGAINSPQLLQLSGVGNRAELERLGIQMVHELPGVGENLQDHLDIHVTHIDKSRSGISFHPAGLWRSIKGLFKYFLRGRTGFLTSNLAQAGGFFKSSAAEPIPDVQWHFLPVMYSEHGQNLWIATKYFGYSLQACVLRPHSRGSVKLASADPLVPPAIDLRYLEDPRDAEKMVLAFKKTREVMNQQPFEKHREREFAPGDEVRTDEQIQAYIRDHSETIYHPVGTCKMGTDPMAVVDPELRVHGVTALRVVDASIMPTLIGGNTNVPTTMIAEKAADMILSAARASIPATGTVKPDVELLRTPQPAEATVS